MLTIMHIVRSSLNDIARTERLSIHDLIRGASYLHKHV